MVSKTPTATRNVTYEERNAMAGFNAAIRSRVHEAIDQVAATRVALRHEDENQLVIKFGHANET
jgi:hypothetical protein